MPDIPFAVRHGHASVRTALQKEGIDDALRNSLWNIIWMTALAPFHGESYDEWQYILQFVYVFFFKLPIDEAPGSRADALSSLRDYFFRAKWFEVYDFIEYLASLDNIPDDFVSGLNGVLEREKAAYRLVDGKITPITSDAEVEAIETAIESSPKGAQVHLRAALAKLSDRTAPDYRNSIKESISAVEAACKALCGDRKANLATALKRIEQGTRLHAALKGAFEKLYNYTSDADGIRHALLDEPTLDFEDALFMLVACSAFTNYLIAKAAKAGISSKPPSH